MKKKSDLLLLIVLLFPILAACASSPQTVKMSTGRTRNVANGRAALWLGIVDVTWREDLNHLVDSAEFELSCDGVSYFRVAMEDRFTEPACSIQVRLIEVVGNSPPGARLEVVWE